MKLSLWMFLKNLMPYQPKIHCSRYDRAIDSVHVYDPSSLDPSDNLMYISDLAAAPLDRIGAKIDPGISEGILLWNRRDWIYLNTTSHTEVINCILSTVHTYFAWSDACTQAIRGNASLSELLNLFEKTFGTPSMIIDSAQYLIAMSDGITEEESIMDSVEANNVRTLASDSILKEFNRVYKETFSAAGTFALPDEFFPTRSYCHNVIVDNERIATIIIPLLEGKWDSSTIQNLEIFVPFLKDWFLQNQEDDTEYLLTSHLARLLDDSPNALEDIERRLMLFGWLPEDPLCVFTAAAVSAQTYSDVRLRRTLPAENEGVYAIPYQQCLVILCNYRIMDSEKFHGLLKKMLIFNHYYGAESLVFHHLSQTKSAYEQALFTLQHTEPALGLLVQSHSKIVYYMADLIRQQSGISLSHPLVQEIRRYDSLHQTEYGSTLFCFLKNERNHKLTADELYIHRNTLSQRLAKIDTLWHPDFNDAETRYHILFSFLLN